MMGKKLLSLTVALAFLPATVAETAPKSEGLAVLGLFGFATSVIADIVTAPASVRSYNRDLPGFGQRRPGPPDSYARRQYAFGRATFHRGALLKTRSWSAFPREESGKRRKSEAAGFFLSAGGTVLPFAVGFNMLHISSSGFTDDLGGTMVAFSLLVGPSLGHFYAHRVGRGFLGVFLRLGFGTLFLTNFEFLDD